MTPTRTYDASCHCRAVRFRFVSEEITQGIRCNCSICIRRGAVMSARYYKPESLEAIEGTEALTVYRFGDHDVDHAFCATCGVSPFSVVAKVPDSYEGLARPGDRRVNLGCVHDLDVLALEIAVVDGRSL
jgi:hypothetical protein